MKQEVKDAIVRSLLTLENSFNSTDEIVEWVERRNREVKVDVRKVPFSRLRGWHFDEKTGNLVHDSGRFFSIVGLDVYADNGVPRRWTQPIINQPEVGYLGIVAKIFDGVMYFMLQSKIEPGNVNCVQLSPTLQATRSNYSQVHKGRVPAYLPLFRDCRPHEIILDQLQSEQGARFLRKRNRNIIVMPDAEVEPAEDFRWLTLGQIRHLMSRNNFVNMDTRTVLSGLRFDGVSPDGVSDFGADLFRSESSLVGDNTLDDALHHLSELKAKYELVVDKIPLNDVREWVVAEDEIVRTDRRYFRVIGVDVQIANREVTGWCQPLVEPMQEGLFVLFAQKRNGIMHFLVQGKVECGNFDVVEMAPTIQCLTGDYRLAPPDGKPAFLDDFVENRLGGRIIFDTLQSEEGGRFYHEQNRNVLYLLDEDVKLDLPINFIWLTMGQIKEFLRYNNYLNIQVRNLVSAMEYR